MSTKPLILLVEDNRTTQETLKRDFEALGVEVLAVPSAEEAWVVLESGKKPDVMILDFQLPGEDGPNFFRRIQRDPRFKKIPVVPFTALIAQDDATSLSKVSNFISSRPSKGDYHVSPIVSKKGREDVYKTPPELILSVGHALKQNNVDRPAPMKLALKLLVESLIEKMDTIDKKPGGQ